MTDKIRLPSFLLGHDLGSLRPEATNDTGSSAYDGDIDNDIQVIKDQIRSLQDDLKEVRSAAQDYQKVTNAFQAQFQPGRTYLNSLLYKLVWQTEISTISASSILYPGGSSMSTDPVEPGFDISDDIQHAFYDISVYAKDSAVNVICQGETGSMLPGSLSLSSRDIIVGIARIYRKNSPRLESYITICNNTGTLVKLYIKVYKKIALT